MQFSYKWLQNHFEEKLPEPKILAEKVGLHSFELEGIEEIEVNGKKDFLIDWDVLPNRSSDCLCYMGMAKEISAVLDLPCKNFVSENWMKKKFSDKVKASDFISLEVEDDRLIKRATKRMVINVKIEESPSWMKKLLESIGQKSINNVVDITNYVMWSTGQPVHAFDYDKLSGEKDFKKIKIGFAKSGEKITDLAGTDHELNENIIVISDGEKPLDIAGIKGGNNSGVDEKTTRLMLSAVNFEFENIRNTSKKLKLQTDASKRFENEVPQSKVVVAMNQMSYLLEEYAGAEISDEILDTRKDYNFSREINCSADKINSLLGLKLTEDEISKIFSRLGLEHEVDSGIFDVNITDERLDLNLWQDLAEEVGRIYGYEKVEEIFPEEAFTIPSENKIKKAVNLICDVLADSGFYEVYNRTIVKDGEVKLSNSLNSKATALHKNLLENLTEKVQKNFAHADEPKFFEIGKIFAGNDNKKEDSVVDEYFSFAGIIGRRKIKETQKEDLFFKTKNYLERVFEKISIKDIEWKKSEDESFVADIFCGDEKLGSVGINFWEMNLETLVENVDNTISYNKVSKYPKIDRDIAFFVPMDFSVRQAQNLLKENLPEEATDLNIFDIYKDTKNNRKSFAFRVVMQSQEKTLSDEFANEVMEKIYSVLRKNNFEIR